MHDIDFDALRVRPGASVDLSQTATRDTFGLRKAEAKERTKRNHDAIAEYQHRLHAEKRQSLLIVLQAMDAAGKDSTIRELGTELNVQGVREARFGKPSRVELAHDFLWRVHRQAPAVGEMVIFNRSHYEDVLIVRVHGWCDPERLERRYAHLNHFESLLADAGTRVIKFMLHISPEYQLSRFKSRLERQSKNWKFNPQDLEERKLWDRYMQAYQLTLERCSTEAAPWYVVPAEERWARDLAVSSIICDTLKHMDPQYPEPDYDAREFTPDSIG